MTDQPDATIYIDLFRTTSTLGAEKATRALGEMIKETVALKTPRIDAGKIDDNVALLGPPLIAITANFYGDLTGRAALVLPGPEGARLASRLTRKHYDDTFDPLRDDLARSALLEAGNILAGAFATTLGDFLHRVVMLTTPRVAVWSHAELTHHLLADESPDGANPLALVAQTELTTGTTAAQAPPVVAHLFLAPDAASLMAMLKAARLAQPTSSYRPLA